MVLGCLVRNFDELAAPCQGELSHSVLVALWEFVPGAPLTHACDEDVRALCPEGEKQRGMMARGGWWVCVGGWVVGMCGWVGTHARGLG